METFIEMFPAIVAAVRDIAYGQDSVSWNRETMTIANGWLGTTEKFSFVLTLMVVFQILSYIRGLTVLLQQKSLDIVRGI